MLQTLRPPTGPTAAFVYGTLRPGYGNHDWTVGHLPHRAIPARVDGFRLVGMGRPFPYAIPDRLTSSVVGEVLVFEDNEWPAALASMDSLEGYPVHYDRVRIAAEPLDGSGPISCWIYTPADASRYESLRTLPGGDWTNNRRDQAHAW